MKIRTVKPEFFKDERLARASRDARLMFIGLCNMADDDGRLRAHPALIRGELFPYDEDTEVAAWLDELVELGLVVRYEHHGQTYAFVRNFDRHQKIDKRSKSKLPPPPDSPASNPADPAEKPAGPPDDPAGPAGFRPRKGREGKGREQPQNARAGARGASDPPEGPKPEPPDPPEVLDLVRALAATPLRSGMRSDRRMAELVKIARKAAPTGLTRDHVTALAVLDREKAREKGALLAHWLEHNLWREVLDEQRMKRRESTLRRVGRHEDTLEDVYADSAERVSAKLFPAGLLREGVA